MKKRLVFSLFVVCMVFILLPAKTFTAWGAATQYSIWVGGVQVTSDNANNITGTGITGTVTYDAGSNTLTLHNAGITSYHAESTPNGINCAAILSNNKDNSLKIVLEGTNTIDNSAISVIQSFGILADSDLEFSGSGSLTVKSGSAVNYSAAIHTDKSLTITDCTIEAISGKCMMIHSGDGCIGLDTGGIITIRNATVRAIGDTSSSSMGTDQNTVIYNSTVTVIGKYIAGYHGFTLIGVIGTASTNVDGSNPVVYNSGSNGSYKWFKTVPEPTYAVAITVKKDDALWNDHGKTFKLVKSYTNYTNLSLIPNGTYDVYDGTTDTGIDVTVNGAAANVTVDYYTVNLTSGAGIISTNGGGTYLKGSSPFISAVVSSGYSFNKWTQTTGGAKISTTYNYTITNIQAAQSYTATASKTPTLTLEVTPASPQKSGMAITLKATISAANMSDQNYLDTVPVTFRNGSTILGTATISAATGIATFKTTTLAVGNYNFYANFAGDSDYNNPAISSIIKYSIIADPDIATLDSAKTAAQCAIYSSMTQVQATSETAIVDKLKATAETAVNDSSVTTTINKVSYTAPVAGTFTDPYGKYGVYTFTVTVAKGVQSQTTVQKTLTITPTSFTGVTDFEAVAAAKTAIVDGTVSVAKGADQTTKTFAVQNYVNNLISTTSDAAGVNTTVTYNSGNSYSVAIYKGMATETKTITMTVNEADNTDTAAVTAAKTVIIDGTVNVPFGADQTAKTAAVQAYVNGILGSTADAAGVSAAVTYNSTSGKYEVVITKGSASDAKSLTMTLNEITDPDIATIAAAKAAAQNASYSNMTQETATGEAAIVNALKTTAETAVNNGSVTVTINKDSYTAPIAGTDGNPGGTNGSYVYTITVSKGSQSQTTEQKTISITATACTGITDEQAVAAAKTALADGSANVALGADQAAKTAAVQAYINGILSSTADAAGVSAIVTYNSTTGMYEVAITKGSAIDAKSLTMTLNETSDPDIVVVSSARSAVEGASYTNMTQAAATSEAVIADSLKATAVTVVSGGAITVTINKIRYIAPTGGTPANPSGKDGSYVFAITVSQGLQSQTTAQKMITITATAYTGITDVQAVAAAKAALVDGLVNIAIGADQTAITAAVQAYVNGILSGTADAAGVTAAVTYNSAAGKYEVALNKGSVSESKSLTMMVTVTSAPGPVTPAPAGSTQTTEPDTETKTITVVEVPQSIPNQELLTVEPVGDAFDTSVEVRLKEDRAAEGMVRTAMESAPSTLNIENLQLFPMDISIYLKGTDTKVQPKEGTAVMITCPIPTEMLTNLDKMAVVCVIGGELQVLPATMVTKDGVPCMQFTATHFSPYALVFDKDNNLADYAAGTSSNVVTNISTKLTVNAGTVTKVDLEGIKEGSTINYHVCTPTLISIDSRGNLFTKKAGNAIFMANVTCGGATTIYTIRVTIKNAKGGTKVGFIRYYDDIVTYNKINYRITAKATDTAKGTVAVANNQINNNLPKKVIIPATITYKGKTYKVTSIDESAFYNLNKITSVTIPAGVVEISTTAFVSCDSLKTFTVSSDNKYYSAKKGMLLNKEGTTLIAYPSAKGTIVIDKKIAVIGSYAFSACKYLTGIVIPKTVTRLDGCAFSHCKSLTNVTFQSVTIPEIPNLCIFDKVNNACTILVPETSLLPYQAAFQNARLPKGIRVDNKK